MRQVMYVEPREGPDGEEQHMIVFHSERSATIAARQWWNGLRMFSRFRTIPMTDALILEEWMVLNWAWFDEKD